MGEQNPEMAQMRERAIAAETQQRAAAQAQAENDRFVAIHLVERAEGRQNVLASERAARAYSELREMADWPEASATAEQDIPESDARRAVGWIGTANCDLEAAQ
eukprot:5621034-Pyramimonas_sp.AAC.1